MSIEQAIGLIKPGESITCKEIMDRADEHGIGSRWGAKSGVWRAVKWGLLKRSGTERRHITLSLTKDGVDFRKKLKGEMILD